MAESTTGRERIVAAALRILDAHGLADLTMRRLAAELDVRASALYWHFESKQVLLAAVADRIVRGAAVSEDAEPAEVALALRDALLAHRDGAEVVLSTQALALGEDMPRRRLAAALARALPQDEADGGAAILVPFVLGHASLAQQRLQAAQLGLVAPVDERDDFRHGVEVILAGLGVPVARQRQPSRG